MAREKRNDTPLIKSMLQQRIFELINRLCGQGHRYTSGDYCFATNPTRYDARLGSFWIVFKGAATGAWRDEATGDKGDIIDLVRYCLGLPDRKTAFDWCRDWLGLAKMTDADRSKVERQVMHDVARRERDNEKAAAAQLAADRRRAFSIWLKGKPISGSKVETYLASRGIRLGALPRVPGILRYQPNMRHAETDTMWPVMVAGLVRYGPDSSAGNVSAIHRTFLAADGNGKAPVRPARKIWPRGWQGCVIPIARGAEDLPLKDAIANGLIKTLALTEGIEDALTLAIARPDWRIWAVGTLGNLAHVWVPPTVERVIVAADNDSGRQARKQLDSGIAALAKQCGEVAIARATGGAKDFNEMLEGA